MLSGKEKGKRGIVKKVYRKSNLVMVEGINKKLKKVKSSIEEEIKGGIKIIYHPLHVSTLALIDPVYDKPTRIKFGFLQDGKRVRVSKKSGSIIEKPMLPEFNPKIRNKDKFGRAL